MDSRNFTEVELQVIVRGMAMLPLTMQDPHEAARHSAVNKINAHSRQQQDMTLLKKARALMEEEKGKAIAPDRVPPVPMASIPKPAPEKGPGS